MVEWSELSSYQISKLAASYVGVVGHAYCEGVVLIPEPAALLLPGLGALIVRRQGTYLSEKALLVTIVDNCFR